MVVYKGLLYINTFPGDCIGRPFGGGTGGEGVCCLL